MNADAIAEKAYKALVDNGVAEHEAELVVANLRKQKMLDDNMDWSVFAEMYNGTRKQVGLDKMATVSIKKDVMVFDGGQTGIPDDMKDKLIDAVSDTLQQAPKGTKAMIVNMAGMTEKEREKFVWLATAQRLCGEKCIHCGYEWCPDIDLGLTCLKCGSHWKPSSGKKNYATCPKCRGEGEPSWRKFYKDNPARSDGKGKFVCERCWQKKL